MSDSDQNRALLGLTVQIVSAHVQNNQVKAAELPALIEQVFAALSQAGATPKPEIVERPAPSVAPKRSIYPDYIICLEDGRKLKTLKRHLRSTYNMSPEQYREKWGLPADYPMVAPNYAERRSALAKQLGLGRKAAEPETIIETPTPAPATAPAAIAAPAPAPKAARDTPRPAELDLTAPAPRRPELNAASVFSKFPTTKAEPEAAEDDTAGVEASLRKKGRKPFSKQLARSMR